MTSLMEDPSVEGFESGGFNRFDWISSGDTEWIVTTDKTKSGMYSARAGSIDNDGSTTLEITLDCTSGTISFYYKVSSESGYARLEFYVDGRQEGEWFIPSSTSASPVYKQRIGQGDGLARGEGHGLEPGP